MNHKLREDIIDIEAKLLGMKQKLKNSIKAEANDKISIHRNNEANYIETLAVKFGSNGSGLYMIGHDDEKYIIRATPDYIVGAPLMTLEIAIKVCDEANNKEVQK